jgi:hypothetical protein
MRTLALVLGLALAAGCDNGKPKGDLPPLHPAKGKVVRAGQPVAGGLVRFHADPDDPDVIVNADVAADGTFELHTLHALSQKRGTGAPAGTYRVVYFAAMGNQTEGLPAGPIELPQKQTIQAGNNDLTLELGKK